MIRAWRAAGPAVRWLIVFGVALASVVVGSGPARATTPASPAVTPCTNPNPFRCFGTTTTSPTTTPPTTTPPTTTPPPPGGSSTTVPSGTTTTTSTTTPVAGPGPYRAELVPCDASASTRGACVAAPTQVAVTYPAGQTAPTVDMTWVKGTASAAPQPASSKATLDPGKAVTCQGAKPPSGDTEVCWPWPGGLTDKSSILNGTYRLTAEGQKAGAVGLAVPPAPPRTVVALATTDQVKVSWQPSASPAPDLVGYEVNRDGQAVYFCSVDGMGPGAGTPCTSPLSVTDHPGAGKWTYTVNAIRLGVDDASGDAVSSAPAAAAPGAVTVAGTAAQSHTAGLSPVGLAPLSPTVGSGYDPSAVSTSTATTAPAGNLPGEGLAGVAPATAPVQNIKYPSTKGSAGSPSDLALKVGEPGSRPDVVPVAVLALGILALAIAAHFVYLRVELGLAEARIADRRRRGNGPQPHRVIADRRRRADRP